MLHPLAYQYNIIIILSSQGCALSRTTYYQTPLYDLTVDKDMNQELHGTGHFEWMSIQTDEDEHSIEMHLPYVAKMMQR